MLNFNKIKNCRPYYGRQLNARLRKNIQPCGISPPEIRGTSKAQVPHLGIRDKLQSVSAKIVTVISSPDASCLVYKALSLSCIMQ